MSILDDQGLGIVPAKPTITTVLVTAETAARWLDDFNHGNRNLSPMAVERYRSDIAAGLWLFAGDPIRFAADGRLLDGQHRLKALSLIPGAALPMVIVRGLPDESQLVMDQGNRRTPGDQLHLKGVKNSNSVGAGVKVYIAWQEGYLFHDSKALALITTSQIARWYDSHEALVNTVGTFATSLRRCHVSSGISWAAALAFAQIDARAASEFFNSLATGGRPLNHPINTLDKRLQNLRNGGKPLNTRNQLSLFIIAWNAWRDGRTLSKLQLPHGGQWTANTFPVPK